MDAFNITFLYVFIGRLDKEVHSTQIKITFNPQRLNQRLWWNERIETYSAYELILG